MNLLKHLYQCSSENIVDLKKFFSLHPDTLNLRSELKSLEAFGYIHVSYGSGNIYEIYFLNKGIVLAKSL